MVGGRQALQGRRGQAGKRVQALGGGVQAGKRVQALGGGVGALLQGAGWPAAMGRGRAATLIAALVGMAGAGAGAGATATDAPQLGYAASFQGKTTIAGIRRGEIEWSAPGWRDVSRNVTWATWVRYSRHSDYGIPFRLVTKSNNYLFDMVSRLEALLAPCHAC